MLVSVQALRALAAWVVVFHHVMQVFFDFQADSFVGRLFAERGAVGVDIFFVISGLVIYLSTPVSYTHLDVYKRQGWWRLRRPLRR